MFEGWAAQAFAKLTIETGIFVFGKILDVNFVQTVCLLEWSKKTQPSGSSRRGSQKQVASELGQKSGTFRTRRGIGKA
jgi:hypothetical protein